MKRQYMLFGIVLLFCTNTSAPVSYTHLPLPGSAETNFGRILRENFQGYRDEMIISSKAGHDMWAGPYAIRKAVRRAGI